MLDVGLAIVGLTAEALKGTRNDVGIATVHFTTKAQGHKELCWFDAVGFNLRGAKGRKVDVGLPLYS